MPTPPEPSDVTAAQALFAAGRTVRETSEPFVPVLIWRADDGETGITALTGTTRTGVAGAADRALTDLPAVAGSGPEWFALLIDAYGRIADDNDSARAEELADRFLLGDTAVVEQLIALVAHRGRLLMWRQVYRHTPADGWEWDDLQWMMHPILPDDGLLEVLHRHAETLA